MKSLTRLFPFAALLAIAISFSSCDPLDLIDIFDDDDEPKSEQTGLKVGDKVDTFQPAVQYDNTAQFKSDLDAFCTYALEIQALRLTWCMLLSKGFETNEMWCSTYDDIDGDLGSMCAEFGFEIIDHIVECADEYEAAINNLADQGVLEKPNQTRGWIASGANFIYNCRNTQVLGRKSVMAILSNSAMATDTRKLKELFDMLPSNLRQGYTDYSIFWNHFSAGKLDARANQIFVNLYTYDPMDFGERARVLGITPGGNITAAGAKLIESGMNVVISSLPCSTEIGYGVDLYNTVNAASDLFTKGDVKGFIQTSLNNAVNYGPYLDNYFGSGKWKGFDLFDSDEWDLALIQEAVSSCLNDGVFTDTFKESLNFGSGERLIPNLVTTRDENGEEIALVCMLDQRTGRLTIGFSIDSEGNVTLNPKVPGTQTLTAVDRNGKRVTKTVVVPPDEPLDVEVDFEDEGLDILREYPENGDLSLKPSEIAFSELGGRYYTNIVTNYLYYTCKTEDKWLSASIPSDMNRVNVTCAAWDGTEDRVGSVIVAATDSKGKVLKTVNLKVTQKAKVPTEYWVSASPSTLEFGVDGGKLETVIDHSYAYNHIGATISSELAGWASFQWKETATGWNIVVDANPNTSEEERSGTITVFAAYSAEALNNAMNGNIDPDLVATTTLLVKQAATSGTDVAGVKFEYGELKLSVSSCKFKSSESEGLHFYPQYTPTYNPLDSYHSYDYKSVSHNPTTSKSGNTITFDLTQHYEFLEEYTAFRWATTDNSFSLTINATNPDDISTYKITAVSGKMIIRETDYYSHEAEYDNTQQVSLQGSIPYAKKEQKDTYKVYTFILKGTAVASAIKSWTVNEKYRGETASNTSMISHTPSDNDYITISLYVKNQ